MAWMNAELKKHGASWDDYYFCPHAPSNSDDDPADACECRKPKPGLILRAAREYNIDLARSALVGDKPSDILAGGAAGIGNAFLVGVDLPLGEVSRWSATQEDG
jgi:D-glycero-D-manno-heptose 1,7-bisphosphate phosphatase